MAYPPPPAPRRPIGVAILAILVILAGFILTLLTGLFLLLTLALGVGLLIALAFIAFLLSVFLLLAGFGLWRLRPWAWWLTVIVLVLGILNQLSTISLTGGLGAITTGQLIAVGIPILILIYLIAVRGAFRSAYR